jgi:hypothetical protein
LRTRLPKLGNDEVDFIWSDFDDGKRVGAWRRRTRGNSVVILANLSGWMSPGGADYEVKDWPFVEGRNWEEAGLDRMVDRLGIEASYEWRRRSITWSNLNCNCLLVCKIFILVYVKKYVLLSDMSRAQDDVFWLRFNFRYRSRL